MKCRTKAAMSAALVLLATAPTGCGNSEVIVKVSGKVTFKGEPVSEGLVLLINAEKGIRLTSELRADGSFDVKTVKGFGLSPGTYQIAITPPRVEFPLDPTEPLPEVGEFPNIPARYRKVETSQLTFAIKEGENPLEIDMSP